MKLTVNIKYMIVQGLFWMLFCVAFGFISLYLLGEGVSNSAIGIVAAVAGLFSAFIQPMFGRICDRSQKINWKNMILCSAGIYYIVCGAMFLLTGEIVSSILLGMLMIMANLILPFVNSSLFYYKTNNEYINFGVARGIGSLMYAVMALVVGNLADLYGTKVVPFMGMIVILLFIIIICFMPYDRNLDNSNVQSEEKETSKGGMGFIKKYPMFILLVVGFMFLLTTHNVTGTYLLQIINELGGNSSDFGMASAIQAVVEVPVLFGFSYLMKKFSVKTLMKVAAIGYVLKAVAFSIAGSVSAIYFVMITQMLSFAIFASASVYYTGETVEEEDRTTGQAIMSTVMVVGTLAGSLVGGFLLDSLGFKAMLRINVLISLLGLAISYVAMFSKKNK